MKEARHPTEYSRAERSISIAFLGPALVTITAVLIVPLMYCIRNSLYAYNLEKSYEGQRFVGLGNYIQALSPSRKARRNAGLPQSICRKCSPGTADAKLLQWPRR
jgi:ABC-type sugar transport system permease subunit